MKLVTLPSQTAAFSPEHITYIEVVGDTEIYVGILNQEEPLMYEYDNPAEAQREFTAAVNQWSAS